MVDGNNGYPAYVSALSALPTNGACGARKRSEWPQSITHEVDAGRPLWADSVEKVGS